MTLTIREQSEQLKAAAAELAEQHDEWAESRRCLGVTSDFRHYLIDPKAPPRDENWVVTLSTVTDSTK